MCRLPSGGGRPAGLAQARRARGDKMAAMKPRTGDGPLEVTKEGRGIVMRVPLEGGGRLVVELNAHEVSDLADALKAALSWPASPGRPFLPRPFPRSPSRPLSLTRLFLPCPRPP